MSIFQLLAVLFALLMIYVVNIHRKKARLTPYEVSFWISIWFLFIVFAIFPNILTGLAGLLSFSRVFDLMVFAAMTIITALVFQSYLLQKENSKKIDDLVRKQAISNHEKLKNKD